MEGSFPKFVLWHVSVRKLSTPGKKKKNDQTLTETDVSWERKKEKTVLLCRTSGET